MYLNGFESVDDIAKEFTGYGNESTAFDPNGIVVLIAVYEQGGYDGQAFVVYRDKADGKLHEVNGSHCSCYGLEGQWDPEEVVIEELVNRPQYLYGVDNDRIRDELKQELRLLK